MNKRVTLFISIMMILLLVACGNSGANQTQLAQAPVNEQTEQFDFQPEESLESKLVLGSLMLEESDMAITSEQAEELLPLWTLYENLLESDTAADAEIDAVVNSIEDAMTVDQIEYIEDMQMGSDEMRQIMEDLGIGFGIRGGQEGEDEGNLPENFTPPGGDFGGAMPGQGPGEGAGGGPPGEGGGFGGPGGGSVELSPEQQETAEAMRTERGGGGRGIFANTELINALIELLEGKLE